MPSIPNLRINSDRLWDSLMEMAEIGGTPAGGCNRQALTPEDARGRALFKRWCEEAGCVVSVDELGSMFARRAGTDEHLPPVMIGSHLDTQPTGGKFDGVLGVLAALEVMRVLKESGVRTRRPIELVNWTNEEGCRFAPAMLASGVFAGALTVEKALAATDSAGKKFGDELKAMGLDCSAPVGGRKVAAFVELHIEQGPILEAEGFDIGFVAVGQGHRWYDVIYTGFGSHAGSTPMPARRDAMAGAVAMIARVHAIGRAHGPAGVATVGEMQVAPNSRNIIPAEVRFTIDIRHPDGPTLDRMDAEVRAAFAACRDAARLEGGLVDVSFNPPVPFDPGVLDVIRAETQALGLRGRDIVSGAGHDSFHMAKVCPTAMIFVPCKDGISHNEAEDITREWAQGGADVLLQTALELADRP
ncbi:MAG: Zn-dependent hydrolase [Hyphomicrobiales bacterium]|nr:Zn-dependent hydrolase [Hyphomicrobiales bacterium]